MKKFNSTIKLAAWLMLCAMLCIGSNAYAEIVPVCGTEFYKDGDREEMGSRVQISVKRVGDKLRFYFIPVEDGAALEGKTFSVEILTDGTSQSTKYGNYYYCAKRNFIDVPVGEIQTDGFARVSTISWSGDTYSYTDDFDVSLTDASCTTVPTTELATASDFCETIITNQNGGNMLTAVSLSVTKVNVDGTDKLRFKIEEIAGGYDMDGKDVTVTFRGADGDTVPTTTPSDLTYTLTNWSSSNRCLDIPLRTDGNRPKFYSVATIQWGNMGFALTATGDTPLLNTLSTDATCDCSASLSIAQTNTHSIALTVGAIERITPSQLEVMYQKKNAMYKDSVTIATDTRNFTLSGLTAGTTYYVWLRVTGKVDGAVRSITSNVVSTTTLPEYGCLGKSNVVGDSFFEDGFDAGWLHSQAHDAQYEFQISTGYSSSLSTDQPLVTVRYHYTQSKTLRATDAIQLGVRKTHGGTAMEETLTMTEEPENPGWYSYTLREDELLGQTNDDMLVFTARATASDGTYYVNKPLGYVIGCGCGDNVNFTFTKSNSTQTKFLMKTDGNIFRLQVLDSNGVEQIEYKMEDVLHEMSFDISNLPPKTSTDTTPATYTVYIYDINDKPDTKLEVVHVVY